jgi:hypothetical protein
MVPGGVIPRQLEHPRKVKVKTNRWRLGVASATEFSPIGEIFFSTWAAPSRTYPTPDKLADGKDATYGIRITLKCSFHADRCPVSNAKRFRF